MLHAYRKTHATMYVGIYLFIARVVLCSFAISEPLSATSKATKNGVINILRFQHNPLLNQHLLSAQSVRILEDMVTVLIHSKQSLIRGDKISNSQPITPSTIQGNARSSSKNTIAHISSESQIDRTDYRTSRISQERLSILDSKCSLTTLL